MDLLTTTQTSELLGVPWRRLHTILSNKIIRPFYDARGTGRTKLLSSLDVLCLAVAVDLLARDYPIAGARRICGSLAEWSLPALRQMFERGQSYLVSVGGGHILPGRLLTADEVRELPIREAAPACNIAIIDVAAVCQRLADRQAAMRAEQEVPAQ